MGDKIFNGCHQKHSVMSVAFSLSVLICFSFFCIVVDDVFSITDKLVILQYSPSCRNVSLQLRSDLINILNIISLTKSFV